MNKNKRYKYMVEQDEYEQEYHKNIISFRQMGVEFKLRKTLSSSIKDIYGNTPH